MKTVTALALRATGLASISIVLAGSLSACATYNRDTTEYALDVHNLMRGSSDTIQSCYAHVLEQDPTAHGSVSVRVHVEARTGAIKQADVNPRRTTAPSAVQQCVTEQLKQLKLTPADTYDAVGDATWNFTAKKPSG